MKNLNMIFKILVVLVILSIKLTDIQAQSKINLNECIYKPEDKSIVEVKLKQFSNEANLPIEVLVTDIGLSFLGTPYTEATLENGPNEKMVINLREFDCTTFVENCLALGRTIKSGKSDFESFVAELEYIRYRDGIRNKYPSRLHYFIEWIYNNDAKKIVSQSPNFDGVKIIKAISFMSSHPESYPVLVSNPELIPQIAENEKQLSTVACYYFPKDSVQDLLKTLKYGDIIGLTARIASTIDINHVGIVILKENVFHLLHASLSKKKVVLSDGPVTDFIMPESINSGIVIARPVY